MKSFSKDYWYCTIHQWWKSFNIYCGHFEKTDDHGTNRRYENKTGSTVVYIKQEKAYDKSLDLEDRVNIYVLSNDENPSEVCRAVKDVFRVY